MRGMTRTVAGFRCLNPGEVQQICINLSVARNPRDRPGNSFRLLVC